METTQDTFRYLVLPLEEGRPTVRSGAGAVVVTGGQFVREGTEGAVPVLDDRGPFDYSVPLSSLMQTRYMVPDSLPGAEVSEDGGYLIVTNSPLRHRAGPYQVLEDLDGRLRLHCSHCGWDGKARKPVARRNMVTEASQHICPTSSYPSGRDI